MGEYMTYSIVKIAVSLVAAFPLAACHHSSPADGLSRLAAEGFVPLKTPVEASVELQKAFVTSLIDVRTETPRIRGCIGNDRGQLAPEAITRLYVQSTGTVAATDKFEGSLALSLLKFGGVEIGGSNYRKIEVEATNIFKDYVADVSFFSQDAKCNFEAQPGDFQLPFVAAAYGAGDFRVTLTDQSGAKVKIDANAIGTIIRPVGEARVAIGADAASATVQTARNVYYAMAYDRNLPIRDFVTCIYGQECASRLMPGVRFFASRPAQGYAGYPDPVTLTLARDQKDRVKCTISPQDPACLSQVFLGRSLSGDFTFGPESLEFILQESGPYGGRFLVRKIGRRSAQL
jgi:hypothetical protein